MASIISFRDLAYRAGSYSYSLYLIISLQRYLVEIMLRGFRSCKGAAARALVVIDACIFPIPFSSLQSSSQIILQIVAQSFTNSSAVALLRRLRYYNLISSFISSMIQSIVFLLASGFQISAFNLFSSYIRESCQSSFRFISVLRVILPQLEFLVLLSGQVGPVRILYQYKGIDNSFCRVSYIGGYAAVIAPLWRYPGRVSIVIYVFQLVQWFLLVLRARPGFRFFFSCFFSFCYIYIHTA